MIQSFIGLIVSLVILIWSCEYAIKNSILVSKIFQIREIFVGIFIIAIGTSLPEFAATFQALQIGAEGIVAGNLVGSNIANILLVGGIMVFPLISLNIVKQDQSTAIFFISFSILFFFLLAIHSSMLNLIRGTHNPVRRNAERIPRAASMPNERKAAISLNKLAANAAIVVREVSIIALPTRLRVVSVASLVEAPFFLSSLYLCRACSESSIPKAKTRIGSRFEN